LLKLGLSPWLGMFVGAFLSGLLGLGMGAISFKYGAKGVFFAFITMALGETMKLITLLWRSLTNGAEGVLIPFVKQNLFMYSIPMQNRYISYYIILLMLIICTYIAYRIKKMRLGYYFMALRENEDAAEMIGVNVYKYKLIAVTISASLTAFAGTFYAQYYQHFEPDAVFGIVLSFEIIFPVIIGGGAYLFGPILGSAVLIFFEEASRVIMPETMYGFDRIVYGFAIVLVLMYLPNGMMTIFPYLRRKLATYKTLNYMKTEKQ
jgi:branched-chain amino acid transport system permease protein